MSVLDPVRNFAITIVSTTYNAAATTVVLNPGHGLYLPDPSTEGAFNAVWWNITDFPDPSKDSNREVVRITAKSTDTLILLRAQEGTSATTKNTAGKTYCLMLTITAKTISDINSHLLFETDANGDLQPI